MPQKWFRVAGIGALSAPRTFVWGLMDLYLPVANLSVNALVIILLGGGVGFLSGMFGVGGGFLTTPLLIFYGIPPTVAAASAATQVTGASVSGGDGASRTRRGRSAHGRRARRGRRCSVR